MGRAKPRPTQQRRAAGEKVRPEDLAILHARLGNVDRAFALLEEAVENRTPYLLFLEVAPHLASLRTDPRFASLLARIERRSGSSLEVDRDRREKRRLG